MSEQPQKPTAPDLEALRDDVTALALLGALLDRVKAAEAERRTNVEYGMNQLYAASGVSQLEASLPDGTKVGTISRKPGEATAQVTDEAAFTAWVRDTFPTEFEIEIIPMQVITRAKPAFVAKVLAEATAANAPRYATPVEVDEATGEITGETVVHDVPGVAIKPSRAPSIRRTYTRKSKSQPLDGRELIEAAYRAGLFPAHVLPVLAPAEPPAEDTAAA